MNENFTFTMSEEQARRVFRVTKSHVEALKNWIVSAVESDDLIRARDLIRELHSYQMIYAGFNIESIYDRTKGNLQESDRQRVIRTYY